MRKTANQIINKVVEASSMGGVTPYIQGAVNPGANLDPDVELQLKNRQIQGFADRRKKREKSAA